MRSIATIILGFFALTIVLPSRVICDVAPAAPEGLPMEFVPWSVEGEAAALLRGDIGIAPTPENPWTAGKCGFKIVQYMAAGLPVVASPVGANAELVRAGESGFLPETPVVVRLERVCCRAVP